MFKVRGCRGHRDPTTSGGKYCNTAPICTAELSLSICLSVVSWAYEKRCILTKPLICIGIARDQKLDTNLFSSQIFRSPPGYPGKNPGISCQKGWFPWASRDIPNLLAPTPCMWMTPTSPEDILTQKFGFVLLFLPWWWQIFQFSESGGSLHGPDLFTDLPFLLRKCLEEQPSCTECLALSQSLPQNHLQTFIGSEKDNGSDSLIVFSKLQPPPRVPTNPPAATPQRAWFRSISCPFRSRFGSASGPFRSASGLLRVLFGVLGGVGVGSGRGASVRERNITRQSTKHTQTHEHTHTHYLCVCVCFLPEFT